MGGFSRWFGATGGLFIQICSGTAVSEHPLLVILEGKEAIPL